MIYKKALILFTVITWPIWVLPVIILSICKDITVNLYNNLCVDFGIVKEDR